MDKRQNLSILSNAAETDLRRAPYPYLVIKNALDAEVFAQLEREFPGDDVILNGRTRRDTWFDYPACKVLNDGRVSPLWRDFFAHHTSGAFFHEIVSVFGPQLKLLHPELESRSGRAVDDFAVGVRPGGRGDPLAAGADVSMECQFYLNYTRQPRVVRGPHVDRPSELFAGLLYFRSDDDDSTGSNLEICAADNDIYPSANRVRISALPMEIADANVRRVETVTYAANTLVLFLNSPRSIHAVSPRSPTAVPRRHINFCADLRFDLFQIDRPARLAAKNWLESKPLGWRLAKHL